MLATGQNNSPNILIHRHQEQEVSIVAPLESPIITFSLMLLQSITTQFYKNCTIVIKQFVVQMIRLQSSPFNMSIIFTFKLKGEQRKYILLISASVEFMLIIKVAEL
jgi:hypothetical protein